MDQRSGYGAGLANATKTAVPGGTRHRHRNGRSCVGSTRASARMPPRLTEPPQHVTKTQKCHDDANPQRGRPSRSGPSETGRLAVDGRRPLRGGGVVPTSNRPGARMASPAVVSRRWRHGHDLTLPASHLTVLPITHHPRRRPRQAPLWSKARDLTRMWGSGDAAQIGISNVDLAIGRGELVAIVGPSGSGKSTLGALIAGIDRPTSGSLVVDGERIDRLSTDRLAAWRGERVGIVFQDFHLLPTLTAAENVELAIELGLPGASRSTRRNAAHDALAAVGTVGTRSQAAGPDERRRAAARRRGPGTRDPPPADRRRRADRRARSGERAPRVRPADRCRAAGHDRRVHHP